MMSYSRQHVTDLQKHLQAISRPYRCRKAALSHGIWNELLKMVEIVHQHRSAAKLFHFMGTNKQSKLYLQPEEALFMMQCSLLQVFLPNPSEPNKIPLALNEAYSLWLDPAFLTLAQLHVSQYLTRIGFILIRHQQQQLLPVEEKNDVPVVSPSSGKRKRDSSDEDAENKLVEEAPQITQPTTLFDDFDSTLDSERAWFPNFTCGSHRGKQPLPRLTFPDRFLPVHFDWLPADFDEKVSQVQLSIHENNLNSPRPSSALLGSSDLQSHTTIYRRLSAFSHPATPSLQSTSKIFFDMYTPNKHFRKTDRNPADFHVQVKKGRDPFRFEDIYNEQHEKTLTAIVHQGDISFYSLKIFDPHEALLSK